MRYIFCIALKIFFSMYCTDMDNLHIIFIGLALFVILKLWFDYMCSDVTEHVANIRPDRTIYNPDTYVNHFHRYPWASDAWLASRGLLPWWNSTRSTRNMSYDLRGDVPVPVYNTGPWWRSPLI